MDGFNHIHTINVRFKDIDVLGHVNNAVILTYVEAARVPFLVALGIRSLRAGVGDIAFIVAHINCDFKQPVYYGQNVEVGTRVSHIGNTSLRLDHRVEADGELAAEGYCVLVHFDYATQQSISISPEMVRKIEAFEGKRLKAGA